MNKFLFFFFAFLILQLTKTFGQENVSIDSIAYFVEDTTRYFVSPININTQNSEYSPTMTKGKMVFSSDRDNLFGVEYTNSNEKPLIDLFSCEKIDSITFKAAKSFSKTINTAFNDGPACFNKDENIMYFSSNSSYKFNSNEKNTQKNLQLFQSEYRNKAWTHPIKLPFCNNDYSFTHPYLHSDGKTLYFSSNMKGGYGGMDLYYSILDEGVWTKPVNLGSNINTSFNEVFPYISLTDILYYSSNTEEGMGGLDVFSFNLNDSIHSKKQLQDAPINSSSDDFGVVIDSKKNQGYLSSNRNEKNKDDIFYFTNKYPTIINCVPYTPPSYCFTFYEENTENNLSNDDNTKLVYQWDLGDGTKIKNIEAKHCFTKPGIYNVELNMIEEASGALFYNEASYEFEVENKDQLILNCPDTVASNALLEINCKNSKIPGATITGYKWNFGDGNYSTGISGKRKYKKEGEYRIQLGVEYKSDSSGIKNEMCLEKRIFVMHEFWKESKDTTYIAPQNKKTIYSTENVDSLNFRVFLGSSEKQIPRDADFFKGLTDIREYLMDSLYLYTAGREEKITDLAGEYRKARANGLNAARVIGYSGDSLLQNKEKLENIRIFDWMVNLKNNNPTFKEFSSNIYFSAFEDSIQKKYLPTLDLISEILKKETELTVSIYAYTDTVGSAEFSEDIFEKARLELSIKRGNVIKKYLEEKGIIIESIKNISKDERQKEENENLQKSLLYNRRATLYIKKKKT